MGATVLCVDSDRHLCQVMAKALAAEGYEVGTEFDGARALERVETDPPDLLLLDVLLPRRDGFAVLEAIRSMSGPAAKLPVVLLCGCSPTPEYQRRARALEALTLLSKPVPVARLLEVVACQLGEPKRSVPSDAPEAPSDPGLAGKLARFSLPALLHHLHGLRATGVLHLKAGRKKKWLQLRDGYPTAVRSNLVNECLGNFLASSGRISPAVMEESRRRMESGRRQGEILVAMDVLTEEEISEALREQAEQKVLEAFGWAQGSFRFEFGARLQKASGLARRSPAGLVLKGVRTRVPLARIDAWLSAQGDARLTRSDQPFYRFQEIELTAEERALVEGLDGSRCLSDWLGGDEGLRRTLYGLLQTGILELSHGEKPVGGGTVTAPIVDEPARRPSPQEDEAQRATLAGLAQRFAGQSHFEVLGVSESAGEEEVRTAYERLAERTHPDRLNAASDAARRLATQVFERIELAFDSLRDPRRRQEHLLDRKRADREAAEREEARRILSAEQNFQQGEAALRQRAYEDALRFFGRALELNPDEGEYPAYYGWTLHLCHSDDAQMAEEAMEHLKRGIKLAPEREKPYLLTGRLCKAIGRVGAAEKMFTRAVQIQPDCVEALRELRLINMRRQRQKGFIGRILRR